MSIEDYKSEFGSTTICKVNDNYHHSSIKHFKQNEGNMTKFSVSGQGSVWVNVSQIQQRQLPKCNYSPGSVRILIAKLDENDSLDYVSHSYEYP